MAQAEVLTVQFDLGSKFVFAGTEIFLQHRGLILKWVECCEGLAGGVGVSRDVVKG